MDIFTECLVIKCCFHQRLTLVEITLDCHGANVAA